MNGNVEEPDLVVADTILLYKKGAHYCRMNWCTDEAWKITDQLWFTQLYSLTSIVNTNSWSTNLQMFYYKGIFPNM